MWIVFRLGLGLAAVVLVVSLALHLLNEPSDLSVAGGYLILLSLVSLAAGYAISRFRGESIS